MRRVMVTGAALMLAACGGSRTPAEQSVANNASAMEAALTNRARELEAEADAAANQQAAEAMDDAADELRDAGRNVAQAADAALDNLQ
jgi:hypothetical protein